MARDLKQSEKHSLAATEGSFELQDVSEPTLYRDTFAYTELPRAHFDNRSIPMDLPKDIWITDTTFRDGQQARAPYTIDQVLVLYDLMHKLDADTGLIRQSEFFLYSKTDRPAVRKCPERGYKFPQVTGWILSVQRDCS